MSDIMPVMSSSVKGDWRTPLWLYKDLRNEFGITLDVCAHRDNTMSRYYLSPQLDALSSSWRHPARVHDAEAGHMIVELEDEHRFVYMNPPYGRNVQAWLDKAEIERQRGVTTVALLPARTDTRWWWKHVRQQEVRFLKGRLKFGDGKNSAPFPSAVVVFHFPKTLPRTFYWG